MDGASQFQPLTDMPDAPLVQAARNAGANLSDKKRKSETREGLGRIRASYIDLLRQYLGNSDEVILLHAYDLGREAVRIDLDLISIGEMHHTALRELAREAMASGKALDPELYLLRAATLFDEFLSPFEMSYQGNRQASFSMLHINETLEGEIRRIAQSIHDEAGQYLACIHIALYELARELPTPARQKLEDAQAMLDRLESELRLVSHELRPRVLEEAGLEEAVSFLADAVMARTHLAIRTEFDIPTRPGRVIETTVYRCVQELLNNTWKHASANSAVVRLYMNGEQLNCEVSDDGDGFDAREVFIRTGGEQLGLLGILERISALDGNIVIDSREGSGTVIRIELPLGPVCRVPPG